RGIAYRRTQEKRRAGDARGTSGLRSRPVRPRPGPRLAAPPTATVGTAHQPKLPMPFCSLHPLRYRPDPSAWFERIRHAPGAVLLDSGRPTAQRGRHDLLSAWPLTVLEPHEAEAGTDFLQRLRQALGTLGPAEAPADTPLPFVGGLIGMLAYDFGRRLEELPHLSTDDCALPAARLGLYAWALISDHQLQRSHLVFHPSIAEAE